MTDPSKNNKDDGRGISSEEMLIRLESATHVSSLTKKLEEQFLNESMVDVALVTEEGKFIYAHKFILSAGSLYFKNIIENAGKLQKFSQNSSLPMIICLSSVKHKHLYPLIKYVYTGCVDIPQNDLKILVKTAFQLKISGLYEEASGEQEKVEKNLDSSASAAAYFQERVVANDLDGQEFADDDDDEDNGVGDDDEDLSIEAFIKEEQEGVGNDYDLGDMENNMDDEESNAEPQDSLTYGYAGGHSSSNFYVDPRADNNNGAKKNSETSVFHPLYHPPQKKMTKGHSSSSSSIDNTVGRRRNEQDLLPYHCTKCGSGYKCSKSLWRHRRYNCPATESINKVTFVCKLCSKAFSRADNLKRHTIISHNINKSNNNNKE